MTDGKKPNKLKTYIENFDDHIEGGIPVGHLILLLGETGTMKSSLAFSILFNNAKHENKSGLYLSIKEDQDNLNYQLRRLNMDINDVGDTILFLDIAAMRLTTEISQEAWFQLIKTSIADLKKLNKCKLLVLDSFDILSTITNIANNPIEIFDFIRWLKELELTTILISEKTPCQVKDGKCLEAQLADSIIYLDLYDGSATSTYRRLKILKMRGVNHPTDLFKLEITKKGFIVSKT